jgi:trans-aconitate methyltransferase
MNPGAANAGIVQDMYTPMALAYDEIWAPLLRPFGLKLLRMLDIASPRRVLDLGCGVGSLLPDIEERFPGAAVIGSDLTEGMLRIAPSRFGRIAMDCTRSAIAAGSVDAIVSAFMLFHVPDPGAALRCMLEILRPGGGVAIAVWGSNADEPGVQVWSEELDAAGAGPDPAAVGPPDGDGQVKSAEKLAGLLSATGFVEVSAELDGWEQRWTPAAFMDWRTRMTDSRRRLSTLDPLAQAACIERVRERVSTLPAQALIGGYQVVLATAKRG